MSKNHIVKGEVTPKAIKGRTEQTRKLLRIAQEQIYWNQDENGEWIGEKYAVMDFEERDANFHKLWLYLMLDMLGLIGNAKIKVASWLLNHRDRNNFVFANLREIAKDCNVSLDTTFKTIKILKDNELLLQFGRGSVYQISPKMIFKGGADTRLGLVLNFNKKLKEQKNENLETKEQTLPPFQKDLPLQNKIKNDIRKYQNHIKELQFKLRNLNIHDFGGDDFDYDITKQNLYYEIDEEKQKLDNARKTLEYLRENNY